MDQKLTQKLESLFKNGLEFQRKKRERIAGLENRVGPGDLFVFSVPLPISWCVVFSHSQDKDLWFIVPGDDFPEVGTHDVALPDSDEEGPLNFRCSYGLWVHSEDFDFNNRIGQIRLQHVEQIRDHLARIVRGDLPTAESIIEVDEDIDYQEWIGELSAAVQQFEQRLLNEEASEQQTIVIPASAFKQRSIDELAEFISPAAFALAAESAIDSPVESTTGSAVSAKLPVDLENKTIFAIKYDKGLVIQAFGFDDQPPEMQFGESDKKSVQWHQDKQCFTSSLIAFEGGKVHLVIDEQSFSIDEQVL